MKLSEMNTDQLAETLCAISAPAARICEDEQINDDMKKLYAMEKGDGMTALQKLGRMVNIWIPGLLKTHRDDVYAIMSVLTGKSVQEIAGQNGMQTIKDARECIDGELMNFFSSFVNMG